MTPLAEAAAGRKVCADDGAMLRMNAPEVSPFAPVRHQADPAFALVQRLKRTEIFREYLAAFEATTGLPLALQAPDSFQVPLHGSEQTNPFCMLVSRRNAACATCLQFQDRLEAAARDQPKTLSCFAGLVESAIPVRNGEKLIGYLRTGQVFLRPPTQALFRRALARMGPAPSAADLAELEAAYFRTRVIARFRYESMLRLLGIFAQHLAAVSNQLWVRERSAELPAMTKARAFIAAHQTENLRLDELAGAANVTKCYFCKLFKATTGLTFTNYLARVRIEAVKEMLLVVHLRVSEAAYAAGFQSLSQFNRTFVRFAGLSPSAYRRTLSGTFRPAPRLASAAATLRARRVA